jgi:hypothetical protein
MSNKISPNFNNAVRALLFLTFLPSPAGLGAEVYYVIGALSLFVIAIYIFGKIQVADLVLFSVLFASIIVSMLINVGGVDLMEFVREIFKFTVYFFVLIGVRDILKSSAEVGEIRRTNNFIHYIVFFEFMIVALSSTGYGESLVALIYDTSKLAPGADFLTEKIRYTGTFENPNYFGLVLVLALGYLLSIRHLSCRDYVAIMLCIVMVILTGSRTALIAMAILFFIKFLPLYKYYLFTIVFVFISFPYILEFIAMVPRLSVLLSFDSAIESHSLGTRVLLIDEAVNYIFLKPFFGYFTSPIPITDNHFTLLLLRYGFLGLLLISITLFIIFHRARRGIHLLPTIFLVVPVLIFSLTGSFLDNPRMFGIFSLFFAVANANASISRLLLQKTSQKLTYLRT